MSRKVFIFGVVVDTEKELCRKNGTDYQKIQDSVDLSVEGVLGNNEELYCDYCNGSGTHYIDIWPRCDNLVETFGDNLKMEIVRKAIEMYRGIRLT